ncbi:MaoC/PaaZ C-terminal domain-containing protein, partial [Nocardia sp. NPDC060220]
MTTDFADVDALRAAVGTELGPSDWITVDQRRIDLFAEATDDHQWIHVDAERAAAGPYGT